MPRAFLCLALCLSTSLSQAATIDWTNGMCSFRGTYDADVYKPELMKNTVEMATGGALFFQTDTDAWYLDESIDNFYCQKVGFRTCPQSTSERRAVYAKLREFYKDRYEKWEAEVKNFEVEKSFEDLKAKYLSFARYRHWIAALRLNYYISGDPAELRKPLGDRPPQPICESYIDLLNEPDLQKKLIAYTRTSHEVCLKQGNDLKHCEETGRNHMRRMTTRLKADLSIVVFDWSNCLNGFDEVHKLPDPDLSRILSRIETLECED